MTNAIFLGHELFSGLCLFEKGVVHNVAQKLIQTNKDAVKMSKNYFSFQVR